MKSSNDNDNYKLEYNGAIKNGMPHGVGQNTMITHSYGINNDTQAQLERNTITYNSKIAQQSKFNEANFARIQGGVARQAGKAAAIGTLASAAFSFGQSKPGQTLLGSVPNPFA